MKKTSITEVAQRFCSGGSIVLVMLVAVSFAACQSVETARSDRQGKNAYADEMRQLDSADAGAEVEARTKRGDWRFLAYYTDVPKGMNVPGLTPEEGMEFIDSGFFETEVFFDERAPYVFQFEGDPKPWIEAKWRYADRVNRALVRKIRETGRISAKIAAPIPSQEPASD